MHTQTSDIRLLKIFMVVADCGSFAAAQPILNIGLSTISSHISSLETRLGFKLCTRGRSGFKLTDRGKQVYFYAQRLVNELEQFDTHVNNLKRSLSGELRIGLIDNTITDPNSPLHNALLKYTKRKGDVSLKIEICNPIELQQRVSSQRLNIGIGSFPTKVQGLVYTHLYDEEHRLFVGRTNVLYNRKTFPLDLIRKQKIVARDYLHARDLQALGVTHAAGVVDNVEAQAYLILSGAYIGFLPVHYARRWEESGEIRRILNTSQIRNSGFDIVVKSGVEPSNIMKAFIDDLKSSASEIEHPN